MAKIQTRLFEETCTLSWKQAPTFDLDAELLRILNLAKSAFAQSISSMHRSTDPSSETDWADALYADSAASEELSEAT